jgi:hypothetical protein
MEVTGIILTKFLRLLSIAIHLIMLTFSRFIAVDAAVVLTLRRSIAVVATAVLTVRRSIAVVPIGMCPGVTWSIALQSAALLGPHLPLLLLLEAYIHR